MCLGSGVVSDHARGRTIDDLGPVLADEGGRGLNLVYGLYAEFVCLKTTRRLPFDTPDDPTERVLERTQRHVATYVGGLWLRVLRVRAIGPAVRV
ncbi:MAG: hypothetical protein ACRDN7_06390 [Rubrobacter sp.]